jgi:hypothetical protein
LPGITFECYYELQKQLTMKAVNVSTKAKTINSLLKKARSGGLILRSPKGQEFILAEADDFNREIELTRQNKALMKFLDSRGKQTETIKASEMKK